MIKKIIEVKNVGRFRNSATIPNPQLAKHTLIFGANGVGKTTLCAILRSLQTGNSSYVIGRKTIGATAPASVKLLLDTGAVQFNESAWASRYPMLAIFDAEFIGQNVHSGEIVDLDHKRNFYRLIVGDEGVRLAEEDTRLAVESRSKTSEITAAAKAIQIHLPSGAKLDDFLGLPAVADIDEQIITQERTVETVRQAAVIQARAALAEIPLPSLPEGLVALLARTIDDIAQDAERRLSDHLDTHKMRPKGGSWIAEGLTYSTGGACPFCGQETQGLPLIEAYRVVFSASYKALKTDIEAMHTRISELFGDAAITRLEMLTDQNKHGIEFWSRYCSFEELPLLPSNMPSVLRDLGRAALSLIAHKASNPLDVIPLDDSFTAALASYDELALKLQAANNTIKRINALIAAKQVETGAADVQAAEAELSRYRLTKARHMTGVAQLCDEYTRLLKEKSDIDQRKEAIRAQLDTYTNDGIRPPTLQRRPVSRLHPYLTMERSATPVPPVPEPPRRSVGRLSLPAWLETLPL